MKVTVVYDFSDANIEKAKAWAKKEYKGYGDERLLLIDALESGLFKEEYVRVSSIKKKED